MIGLLLKDFFIFKKLGRQYILILLFFIGYGFILKNTYFMQGMFILLISNVVISSMAYDEMSKWDKFALTMPVTRKTVVQGKFIFLLISIILSTVLGIISGVAINFLIENFGEPNTAFKGNVVSFSEICMVGAAVAAVALIIFSIVLTIIFKVGSERSRTITIFVYVVPTFLVVIGAKISEGMPKPDNLDQLIEKAVIILPYAAAILVLAAVCICYFLSLRIYEKKEMA